MNHDTTLQSVNMRNTAGRRAVLAYIAEAKSPLSVDQIQNAPSVRALKLDQATVYRIVNALSKKGILRSVNFQENKSRYELASHEHHHHVVCTNCGAVKDVEDCIKSDAQKRIEKETGFKITSHALEFFGLCPTCADLAA
jgi:Fur family transcriptional regulator, ferric uptake regulator